MENELIIKRCKSCGTMVKVLEETCEIECCGTPMEKLVPNSVDAAVEKHDEEYTVKLEPEEKAEARFKYIPNSTLYAYCNKHGLWKTDVE